MTSHRKRILRYLGQVDATIENAIEAARSAGLIESASLFLIDLMRLKRDAELLIKELQDDARPVLVQGPDKQKFAMPAPPPKMKP